MSETRLTVEQIIAAVNQLELEEFTMLNKHLSMNLVFVILTLERSEGEESLFVEQ